MKETKKPIHPNDIFTDCKTKPSDPDGLSLFSASHSMAVIVDSLAKQIETLHFGGLTGNRLRELLLKFAEEIRRKNIKP